MESVELHSGGFRKRPKRVWATLQPLHDLLVEIALAQNLRVKGYRVACERARGSRDVRLEPLQRRGPGRDWMSRAPMSCATCALIAFASSQLCAFHMVFRIDTVIARNLVSQPVVKIAIVSCNEEPVQLRYDPCQSLLSRGCIPHL